MRPWRRRIILLASAVSRAGADAADARIAPFAVRRQGAGGDAPLPRRFTPAGGGFEISGTLEIEVIAPPRLEALARMERERPDTLLFPIVLDRAGKITPHHPQRQRRARFGKAAGRGAGAGVDERGRAALAAAGAGEGFVESLFAAQGQRFRPGRNGCFAPAIRPEPRASNWRWARANRAQ
jgi:hypothetical protein